MLVFYNKLLFKLNETEYCNCMYVVLSQNAQTEGQLTVMVMTVPYGE